MVLDGNADPVAWATGTAGSANALGTLLRMGSDRGSSDTLDQFLTLCGRATTSSCAFSAGTPAATHTKLDTLLDRLASHPITMNGQTFTVSATMHSLVGRLYNTVPIAGLVGGWPDAADFLQSLWDQTSGATPAFPKAQPGHAATPNGTAPNAAAPYSGLESIYGVLCSDSPNPRGPAEYAAQADFAATRSGLVGPYWAWIAEPCARWPVLSADRYTGPWNTPTARPILVVGNTFDPSTRYQNSVTMAHDLGNARLLTLNGYGHTAQANPSACVNRAEDDYFVTGTLPPPGTVCQQDKTPFAG